MNQVLTESELAAMQDKKTYSISLTAEQRKLLGYSGIAIVGFFLAKYMIRSAVKSLREE